MDCLELVLFLLIQIAHLGEDLRIAWYLSDEYIVPLEGLSAHSNQFVDMSDLVDHLVAIWDDSVKLLKSLKTFVVITKTLVYQTQVIDCFDAISLNTNSFKEKFLCTVIVLIDK
jgi:hypothetical protein